MSASLTIVLLTDVCLPDDCLPHRYLSLRTVTNEDGEDEDCGVELHMRDLLALLPSSKHKIMFTMSLFKHVGMHRMALGFCPSADCSQVYRRVYPQKPDAAEPNLKRPKRMNAREERRFEKQLAKLVKEEEKKAEEKWTKLKAAAAKETEPFANKPLFHCETCGEKYCTRCLTAEGLPSKWHGGVSCEEFHARKAMSKSGREAAEAFLKWRPSQGAKVKPCPDCGILCEKVSGCNRITCGGCKNSWCWKCGKFSADTAAKVYAHLNKEHGGYH